jgi:hypothetical protein
MRKGLIALVAIVAAGCAEAAPNPFPDGAKARFDASCPSDNPVCQCTWDKLTRTLTYDEYEAAMARFREEGLMDPRITRARGSCIERHRT